MKKLRKTTKMKALEAKFQKPIKEILQELYNTKTMPQMVEHFKSLGIDVSQGTLSQWFLRLGIPARSWQLPSGKVS